MESQSERAAIDLITSYASRTRQELGLDTAPVVSYAGLWLLLASLAPAADGDARVESALGLHTRDAAAIAAELLARTPDALMAAVGAWVRPNVSLRTGALPPIVEALRDQAQLDAWCRDNTSGMVDRFPIEVTDDRPDAAFATALAVDTEWTHELEWDEDGLLELEGSRQFLIDTTAAGIVAASIPEDKNGVDVISVIAAADVPPAQVWEAVDEVLTALASGSMSTIRPSEDGHAWTITETEETFLTSELPADALLFRSHLPSWNAEARFDLTAASGISELATALAPPDVPIIFECAQAASATYSETGFKAAAVTALAFTVTGIPELTTIPISRVDVAFDRPHAVVAVARGGVWDRVPLFHAWVTPEMWTAPTTRKRPLHSG